MRGLVYSFHNFYVVIIFLRLILSFLNNLIFIFLNFFRFLSLNFLHWHIIFFD